MTVQLLPLRVRDRPDGGAVVPVNSRVRLPLLATVAVKSEPLQLCPGLRVWLTAQAVGVPPPVPLKPDTVSVKLPGGGGGVGGGFYGVAARRQPRDGETRVRVVQAGTVGAGRGAHQGTMVVVLRRYRAGLVAGT